MPNSPGSSLPDPFRFGQVLKASDLNRIVNMIAQRIVGGNGIRARAFGGQIILETTLTPARKGGAGTPDKVGLVVSGSGSGPYTVNVYDNGMDQPSTEAVEAYPLSGEDIEADTAVILVWVEAANDGAGRWYFQTSAASSPTTKIGLVSNGSGSGPYNVLVYDDGIDQPTTGVVSAYPLAIAAGQSFPSGTPAILVWVPGANGGAGRWYFQGPVWLND